VLDRKREREIKIITGACRIGIIALFPRKNFLISIFPKKKEG